MSIRLRQGHPSVSSLRKDGYPVIYTGTDFEVSMLPYAKIGVLNLMPLKHQTDDDLIRVLSRANANVDLILIETSTYRGSHTAPVYLDKYYEKWSDVKSEQFDGFIITGAPVEEIDFEYVVYWNELREIMDWCRENVRSTLYICWGAQAGLYHFYGIRKYKIGQKLSGVFEHEIKKQCPIVQGLSNGFPTPHSRHTTIKESEVRKIKDLEIVTFSRKAGVHCVMTKEGREVFLTGHSEYAQDTLLKEYQRDMGKGLNPNIPVDYFDKDRPDGKIVADWKNVAERLYGNWVENYVIAKSCR